MKGRKIFIFLIFGLFLFSLLSLVSADAGDVFREVSSNIIDTAERAFGPIIDFIFSDRDFLTRILFFLLVLMVIYSIVSTIFNKNLLITLGISIVISILSVFFMPIDLIDSLRVGYGAMGAAILSVIPFLIMLVFSIRVQSALVARMVWVFFSAYYFALYLYKLFTGTGGLISVESIFPLFGIIAGIMIFFFIGPVKRAIFKGQLGALRASGEQVALRAKLLHKLQEEEIKKAYGDSAR